MKFHKIIQTVHLWTWLTWHSSKIQRLCSKKVPAKHFKIFRIFRHWSSMPNVFHSGCFTCTFQWSRRPWRFARKDHYWVLTNQTLSAKIKINKFLLNYDFCFVIIWEQSVSLVNRRELLSSDLFVQTFRVV